MASINSMICSISLIKENLRRFWLLPVLITLVYILGVIVPLQNVRSNTHLAVHDIVAILQMRYTTVLLGMVIVPLITICLVFGFFYKAKESALVQSFPYSRTQVLLSSALSGIILMIIPTLILSIGLLLMPIRLEGMEQLQGRGLASLFRVTEGLGIVTIYSTINTFPVMLGFFLRMMIAKIFYFAVFWLAFSLTGQAISTILLALVMPLIPYGVAVLVISIARYYVFGFYPWYFGSSILVFSNPAVWGMILGSGMSLNRFYLWYSMVAMIIMCIAFTISRLRKPERVGNPAMFNPIKHILVFLVSLTFMIFGGILFYSLTHSHSMFFTGLFVGFILGFIIAQMIAEKSLIITHKARSFPKFFALAASMFLLMMFVTQVGMRFYTNYIPRQEDIIGVTILHPLHFHHDNPAHFNSEPQMIALIVDIHNEILDNRGSLLQPWRIRFGQNIWSDYFNINYLMNDGRVISRRYQLNPEFVESSSIPKINIYLGVEND